MINKEMFNLVTIREAKGAEDIEKIAVLADKIWHEHFPALLSAEQIDYMVDKFQSFRAISEAVKNNGYRYYMAYDGDDFCGYLGFCEEGDNTVFISKIYVRSDKRRCGVASSMLRQLRDDIPDARKWYLTVNRFNSGPIEVYKKRGFEIVREQKADIGNGFIMDDYIMEKTF